MNIKTKLTYGIGLLFVLITLLGGLAIKNIHNVSDDTQNILADNYNSLLYSRQMLESLDAKIRMPEKTLRPGWRLRETI